MADYFFFFFARFAADNGDDPLLLACAVRPGLCVHHRARNTNSITHTLIAYGVCIGTCSCARALACSCTALCVPASNHRATPDAILAFSGAPLPSSSLANERRTHRESQLTATGQPTYSRLRYRRPPRLFPHTHARRREHTALGSFNFLLFTFFFLHCNYKLDREA